MNGGRCQIGFRKKKLIRQIDFPGNLGISYHVDTDAANAILRQLAILKWPPAPNLPSSQDRPCLAPILTAQTPNLPTSRYSLLPSPFHHFISVSDWPARLECRKRENLDEQAG